MDKPQLTKESFTNYRYFEADDWQHQRRTGTNKCPDFVTYLTLFQSSLYRINDLNCYYNAAHVFKPTLTGQFSINFTRKGYFTFQSFQRLEEEYASRIMLEKPGCEFRFVQPEPGAGACTVLSFTHEGYNLIREQFPLRDIPFFTNENAFSTVVSANAPADFLHHRLLCLLKQEGADPFEIDCLVTELVAIVMQLLNGQKPVAALPLATRRYHLPTIERARDYLLHHFTQDVTLQQLARYCHVSHFHFTRLFKQCCGYSPFHYLQQIRLKYAETLMCNSGLPVADVCFKSGFKRLDYFSSAFAKQFGAPPTKYKAKVHGRKAGLQASRLA